MVAVVRGVLHAGSRSRLASLCVLGALLGAAVLPTGAAAQQCTYIVEGTRWLWHDDPPPSGWGEAEADDDPEYTTWQFGCTPFSSSGCGFAPGTFWSPDTTRYVRQHVYLTGAERGLVASIAIDNDFTLYVNGFFVSTLVHEGCATRWDAVVAIPDAYWVVGDNVVALQLTDRGGITNFEMTLMGPSPGTCPPGCAQLPCNEPPPVVTVPDVVDCAGDWTMLAASATWGRDCAGTLSYRFHSSSGKLLRDWGAVPWVLVQAGGGDDVLVDVRCSQSPTCPLGSGLGHAWPRAFPPGDPGSSLRVRKAAGLASLSWVTASPLLPGEHDHVIAAGDAVGPFYRVNGEGETTRTWIDPAPFGRACYLVRVADSCEIESYDDP